MDEDPAPTKVLIYEALISFLKGASSLRGLNSDSVEAGAKVRMLQTTVDNYMASMSSDSVVNAVVGSLECRKKLLELSSKLGLANDPKLRAALRADEKRIATISHDSLLRLEGDSAQHFLDVVQDTLDRGFILEQEHSRMALRIIRKLSESCDRLPSSLFIIGVNNRDEHPTFGGGYGDIYRAPYGGQRVALKRMRHFLRGSDLRRIRLKYCLEALVWKDLYHPHILPFLGIDRDSFPSSLCMVSPWMEHGTVMNHLQVHGHGNVDKLLYEIAQGLEYLHSYNIVHGDLRGTNILIKEDWTIDNVSFASVVSAAQQTVISADTSFLRFFTNDKSKEALRFTPMSSAPHSPIIPLLSVLADGGMRTEVKIHTETPPVLQLDDLGSRPSALDPIRNHPGSASPAVSDDVSLSSIVVSAARKAMVPTEASFIRVLLPQGRNSVYF
ncbi:Kinase-like protein [Mycena venus]|uniref:Kinase-like protein n=1 Tax=Mycena venus TaxID=2733690 RepID=A0A8H6U0W9_9AGAR|nr:Kinase-like protein [Mycena venus]